MTGEGEKPRLSVVAKPRQQRLNVLLVGRDKEAAFAICRVANGDAPLCVKYAIDRRAADALLDQEQWDLLVMDPIDAADFAFLLRIKTTHRWTATMVMSQGLAPELL